MSRTIILPAGISVLGGLERLQVRLNPGYEAAQLTADLVNSLKDVDYLSAELATLKELKASSKDQAVFLATDTDDGERAARVNAIIAKHRFQVEADIKRIEGLVLDDAKKFKEKGVRQLFWGLDYFVGQAMQQGRDPILSVSGGIKSVAPYIALYGMLRRVPVTYIFEVTRDLITLPPLPIDFDWGDLRAAEPALNEINKKGEILRSRLEQLLGGKLLRLEGLFEDAGNDQVTLSAFGFMVLEDLSRASQTPVMLSSSVQRKLKEANDIERSLIELLLDRVRSPLWRAQKCHAFSGTDLEVYKPGSTSHRLAVWGIEGETVYVAEIYTSHDEYERDLPSRRLANYDKKAFTPYYPNPPPVPEEKLEESGDEMIAIAISEKERAERARAQAETDRDEALKMAAQMERTLLESSQKTDDLRKRVAELEAKQRERDSWGLWQRIRWALFGS